MLSARKIFVTLIHLPHAQSYIKNKSPQFQESDFMNFLLTTKTYLEDHTYRVTVLYHLILYY